MVATINSALNVLPTIPGFVQGESSLANLNNLSYAVSFICDCDVRPTYHAIMNASDSLSAGAWTSITGGFIAIDTDNQGTAAGNAMQPVITTTGIYCFEFSAGLISGANVELMQAAVLFTPGANNPRYASGTVVGRLGKKTTGTHNASSADTVICVSDITPVLYPGDTLQPQIWIQIAGFTSDYNNNASFALGRFQTQITTYYVRAAT